MRPPLTLALLGAVLLRSVSAADQDAGEDSLQGLIEKVRLPLSDRTVLVGAREVLIILGMTDRPPENTYPLLSVCRSRLAGEYCSTTFVSMRMLIFHLGYYSIYRIDGGISEQTQSS
jgi:hypothetical protein